MGGYATSATMGLMSQSLDKPYDAAATERKIGARWEETGYANPDNLPARHTDPFVVMLPPPNVTGTLHIGHALENSLTDCLVRFRRMQGRKVLWLPGTDHAGIATQRVVEKKLKKERDKRPVDIGREEFLKEVWAWREEYGDRIYQQLKRMGASLDFSRSRFTMDEPYEKAVQEAFSHYHEKGWIYQGRRIVNWCPRCRTSLSDLELEYEEKKDFLYYIDYPIVDGDDAIRVATTRPETMFGDTAIAVHPDDKRWKKFIGKDVAIPLTDRTIPVIADDGIEMEFGTGALKVTPAHDFSDAQIGERHDLPAIQVIDERGKMNENAPESYRDLKVADAQKKVVEDLEAAGALPKTEPLTHNVSLCYRCNQRIEPLLSKQWFLKMSELAKAASAAYESGKVKVTPNRWLRVALDRLAVEHDWCISRQLWWGHKIPIEGEEDVLDTWFSSALWPFATLGWPEKTDDLKSYYPGHWMTSARDILFLWINRMVFSGVEFMGEAPFAEVFIHPTVLTKGGKRMSKSLGTGIDPIELIDKYGADATRFGLLWQTTGVQDIRFDESAIAAGRKFSNKIWNATRYVLMNTEGTNVPDKRPAGNSAADTAILEALDIAIVELTDNLERLRFGQALEGFYEFFWHNYCDIYLEQTKTRSDDAAKEVLLWILAESIKALHPFIPFITDELWEHLPHDASSKLPLMVAPFPTGKALPK